MFEPPRASSGTQHHHHHHPLAPSSRAPDFAAMTVSSRRSVTAKSTPSTPSSAELYGVLPTADFAAEVRPSSRRGSSGKDGPPLHAHLTRYPSSSGAATVAPSRPESRRSAGSLVDLPPETARPESRRSSRPGSRSRGVDPGPLMPPSPAMDPLDFTAPSTREREIEALSLSCRFSVLTFGSQFGRMQPSGTPRTQPGAAAPPSMQDYDGGAALGAKSALVNLGGAGLSGGMGMSLGGSGGSGGLGLARRSLGSVTTRDDAEPALSGHASVGPQATSNRRGMALFRASMTRRQDPDSATSAASDDDSSSDQDMYHLDDQGPRSAPYAHMSLAHSLHHGPPASEEFAGLSLSKPRAQQQMSRPFRLPPLHS